LRAILRIPVANIIAIMAGRRAVMTYLGTLSGSAIEWDKTDHAAHPTPPMTRRLQGTRARRRARPGMAEAESLA